MPVRSSRACRRPRPLRSPSSSAAVRSRHPASCLGLAERTPGQARLPPERGVHTFLPIARWLPHYERGWLGADLVAGLTSWAMVVPQAVAYGAIAGLPAQSGLAAAFAGPFAYGLLGTC